MAWSLEGPLQITRLWTRKYSVRKWLEVFRMAAVSTVTSEHCQNLWLSWWTALTRSFTLGRAWMKSSRSIPEPARERSLVVTKSMQFKMKFSKLPLFLVTLFQALRPALRDTQPSNFPAPLKPSQERFAQRWRHTKLGLLLKTLVGCV